MKFTLVYDGELSSSGNRSSKKGQKWRIREALQPQLAHLWDTHPALEGVQEQGVWLPRTGSFSMEQRHHSLPGDGEWLEHRDDPNRMNLAETKDIGGYKFLPLIRSSFALTCSMDILFLRMEKPGSLVLQGGDIDNRLKTLFDAMKVPEADDFLPSNPSELPAEPFHCLLESDALITGFNVRTDRLLSSRNLGVHEVHLVIEVTVSTSHSMLYNLPFMGS